MQGFSSLDYKTSKQTLDLRTSEVSSMDLVSQEFSSDIYFIPRRSLHNMNFYTGRHKLSYIQCAQEDKLLVAFVATRLYRARYLLGSQRAKPDVVSTLISSLGLTDRLHSAYVIPHLASTGSFTGQSSRLFCLQPTSKCTFRGRWSSSHADRHLNRVSSRALDPVPHDRSTRQRVWAANLYSVRPVGPHPRTRPSL